MKCPCCKIYNCATEVGRHHSHSALLSLAQAVKEFSEAHVDTNATAIRACEHHSDPLRLTNWFDVTYRDALTTLNNGIVVRRQRGYFPGAQQVIR